MALTATQLNDLRGRVRASLLGCAVGDALGATVEFMTPREIQHTYGVHDEIRGGGWLHLSAGQVTDDTLMSLCIARSIANLDWAPKDIAERFAAWLRSKPVDVGATCRRGIRRFMLEGTLEAPPNDGDAGNGAAMRMAPVAIATLGDTALMEQRAVQQAHLTHHHPLSDAACVLVGHLIQMGCLGKERERLLQHVHTTIGTVPAFRFNPYRGLATGYVTDTMQTVLHHFFRTRCFEDCLVGTVNQGGDADTTGAIVGAIAGAYYGLDGIPSRWLRRLDPQVVQEITLLSDCVLGRAPLTQGMVVEEPLPRKSARGSVGARPETKSAALKKQEPSDTTGVIATWRHLWPWT